MVECDFTTEEGPADRTVYIYGSTGNLISRTPITNQTDPSVDWVKYENRWYVAVLSINAADATASFLIDPESHKQVPLFSISEVELLNNSDEFCNAKALNGLCIRRFDDNGKWRVTMPKKTDQVIDTGRYAGPDFADLSAHYLPDGLKLAFVDNSGCLFILHDGFTTPIVISRGITASNFKDCLSQGDIRDMTWGDQVRIAARTT